MKNFILTILIFLIFSTTQCFAYNLKDFSNDAKILSAMQLLEQSGDTDVFENLKRNAVKVKFYNLSTMSAGQNVFAANTYNQYGRRVILINSIYKDAPAEQIACLIAHESYHTARKATLDEETRATTKEAQCSRRLQVASNTYPQTRLTKRLNRISNLEIASTENTNYIQDKIANSSFYKTQFSFN